ncbi:MAG: hypothetical protein E7043_02485 [Lentisphaerae bacterium]|nr:hypothetical protein [Lentisphaerota bacterium]
MEVQMSYDALIDFACLKGKLMFRPASGKLAYPYLDPGGPYSASLWDWDSYWGAVALFEIARRSGEKKLFNDVCTHACGALMNFFAVQHPDGSLPIMMTAEDADWFDSLGAPGNNMAKPVQAQFLKLLWENGALEKHTAEYLLQGIRRACECRFSRYRHEASSLLVWANDIAIGIDDDPAVWGRPDFSAAHIFLNSLMVMELNSASEVAGKLQCCQDADYFRQESSRLAEAVNRFCWDRRDKWYYSCDVQCRQNLRSHRYFKELNTYLTPFWQVMPLRIRNFCGVLPLAAGIASPEQAAEVVAKMTDPAEFRTPYGIRTMSAAEDRFYEDKVSRGNPSNWLGPVWIIANYLTYIALKRYGFTAEAAELAKNTVQLLDKDFRSNGIMHEYYDPSDGTPISGPGFLNWNLLFLLMEEAFA